jgi:hypothetical protein
MVLFAPTSSETLEDQRRYLEGRMAEVACLDCLATVQVRKHSEPHTSIQWTAEAVAHCTEFAKQDADGGRAIMESCPRMKASIARAVAEGRLEVGGGVD